MKTMRMLLVGAMALGLTAVANAQPSARAAGSTTIGLRHTSLGEILVAPKGRTLYEFSRDRTNVEACQTIKGCTSVWPPLTTSGSVNAGLGVNARLLGTVRLENGSHQVTYAGHPLYTYVGDSGPGETEYVGEDQSGGFWYALNAHGSSLR